MTGVPGQPAFCPAGTGPCTGAPNPPTALADHTSTAIAGGSVLLAIALAQVLIVPSEFTTRRASRRAAPSPGDAVDDRELGVRLAAPVEDRGPVIDRCVCRQMNMRSGPTPEQLDRETDRMTLGLAAP